MAPAGSFVSPTTGWRGGIGGLLEDYAFCAEGLFALYGGYRAHPLV